MEKGMTLKEMGRHRFLAVKRRLETMPVDSSHSREYVLLSLEYMRLRQCVPKYLWKIRREEVRSDAHK